MAIIHVLKVTAELIHSTVDGHARRDTPHQFEAKYPAWIHGQPRAGVQFETSTHRQLLVTRKFI